MADLQEFQYELDGYVFGVGCPLEVRKLSPGTRSWRTQDTDAPQAAARYFGKDYGAAGTWALDMYVNEEDPDVAFDRLETISEVFSAEHLRQVVGATSVLRYCLPGRTRRVYGRTKRFDAPPDNGVLVGYLPITADFACADTNFYDDVESSVEVGLQAAAAGGLRAPLVAPLSTVNRPTQRAGRFVVEGKRPTWITVTFSGPVTNPKVTIGNLEIQLLGTLPYDMTVTLDPRPWVRATTYGGAYSGSAAGLLGPRVNLDALQLPPGGYEAVFSGIDATGQARAAVSWRAAYSSL